MSRWHSWTHGWRHFGPWWRFARKVYSWWQLRSGSFAMAPELVGSGNEGASVAQNAGTEGTLATAEPTKSGRVTKAQKAEKDLLEFLNKLKSSGKGLT